MSGQERETLDQRNKMRAAMADYLLAETKRKGPLKSIWSEADGVREESVLKLADELLRAALAAREEPQTCARSSELASSEGGQQKVEHRRSEAEVGGSIPSGRLQANVVYVQFPDGEIRLLSMEGAPALGETVVYDEPRIYAGRYVVADAEWRFSGGVGEAAFSRRTVILAVATERPMDDDLTELVEMPRDLAQVLRDPGIIVRQDAAVFELIAKWQHAPSPTMSGRDNRATGLQ